jgi:hypothetical protein
MNAILTKPLSRDALRKTVRRFLAEAIAREQPSSSQANEMRDLIGEKKYGELRSRFVEEVDVLHGWFGADPLTNLPEIATRAHKVAGSAALFGATNYRAVLIEVENAAKAEQADDVRSAITRLGPVWDASKSAF